MSRADHVWTAADTLDTAAFHIGEIEHLDEGDDVCLTETARLLAEAQRLIERWREGPAAAGEIAG